MKLSKYVQSISRADGKLLYHSQIGQACVVDDRIYEFLSELVFDKSNEKNYLNQKEIFYEFQKMGFIVDKNDVDYIEQYTNERMKQLDAEPQIRTVQLIVSNACNFNCRYCFENNIYCSEERNANMADPNNVMMSPDNAKSYMGKCIDLIKKTSHPALHVQFFGGEPTTNMEAIRAVLDCYSDGGEYGVELTYSIVTNGSLIDKETAALFKKYDVATIVSFDNPSKSDRKLKDGRNSEEVVRSSLEFLKEENVYTAFNSVLSSHTLEYFDNSIIDYANVFNVKEVGVVLDLDPDFYSDNNISNIVKKILSLCDYASNVGILVSGYWMTSYLNVLARNGFASGFKTCSGTGSQLSIEPNGTVFSCKGSSCHYGSIADIDSMLRNEHYRRYAERSIKNSDRCKNCEIEGFCAGFCLGPLEQTYKSIYELVPGYCRLMKTLIFEFLKRETNILKYEY